MSRNWFLNRFTVSTRILPRKQITPRSSSHRHSTIQVPEAQRVVGPDYELWRSMNHEDEIEISFIIFFYCSVQLIFYVCICALSKVQYLDLCPTANPNNGKQFWPELQHNKLPTTNPIAKPNRPSGNLILGSPLAAVGQICPPEFLTTLIDNLAGLKSVYTVSMS